MKFRKKPVVVDAFQWKPEGQEDISFPDWLNDALVGEFVWIDGVCLKITTLEGRMTCGLGDWVIKGIQGELYPCKDDIFRETYERVEEETE